MPAAERSAPPAIELDGVEVRYFVPREAIASLKEYALKKLQGRIEHDELIALSGVSLSLQPGESVGVIGPNGAGKSTLFKVIARVRRPTAGRVVVRGHVAPLLELGLGFHSELTGRENIVIQGTLMGYSRKRMRERIGEIAAFAELEPFLDAPLRTYSTGMAARLAFAVATDVDPDILLVDEALSVGDERFRAKCSERMASLRGRGKTFLLVSHSLADVVALCERAVWVQDGRIARDGPAKEVTEAYHQWAQGPGSSVGAP